MFAFISSHLFLGLCRGDRRAQGWRWWSQEVEIFSPKRLKIARRGCRAGKAIAEARGWRGKRCCARSIKTIIDFKGLPFPLQTGH